MEEPPCTKTLSHLGPLRSEAGLLFFPAACLRANQNASALKEALRFDHCTEPTESRELRSEKLRPHNCSKPVPPLCKFMLPSTKASSPFSRPPLKPRRF